MIRIVLLIVLAIIWFGVAYFVPPLGILVAVIHIVCFFLDAGMNGLRYAEWAPYNVAGAALALVGGLLGMPS
jgi:hypothetical protein